MQNPEPATAVAGEQNEPNAATDAAAEKTATSGPAPVRKPRIIKEYDGYQDPEIKLHTWTGNCL